MRRVTSTHKTRNAFMASIMQRQMICGHSRKKRNNLSVYFSVKTRYRKISTYRLTMYKVKRLLGNNKFTKHNLNNN